MYEDARDSEASLTMSRMDEKTLTFTGGELMQLQECFLDTKPENPPGQARMCEY